jgi:phosphate transport system protein
MNMHEHLSKQFDADLTALRSSLLAMGALVEEQVRYAIEALLDGKGDLAEQVIAKDRQVNALEVDIDDDCARVIAKRQPTASDLRMVLGVSKIAMDLERIGDKARKIARLAVGLGESDAGERVWLERVRPLGNDVRALLRAALAAFRDHELDGAIEVIRRNIVLGRQAQAIAGDVVGMIAQDPAQVPRRLDMLTVTRSVDRIADHGGNIAEHLIYIVKGTDVRHSTLAEIERETRR